jgi:hypothetical protein
MHYLEHGRKQATQIVEKYIITKREKLNLVGDYLE